MSLTYQIDYKLLFLVILRVTAFITVSQVFFPKGIHNTFKIIFSVVFSFMIFPIVYEKIGGSFNLDGRYIFLALGEGVIGVLIGIFVNLLFNLFNGIGSILDSQGGFSSAQVFDPMTNNTSSVIERMFYFISLIVFVLLNGHHYFIRAIIYSYSRIGIGNLNLHESFLNTFIYGMLTILKASFMIVLPIMIVLIFVDIILGIISKVIPKINLIVISFPFKILVTVALLIVCIKIIFTRFTDIYLDFNKLIFRVFSLFPVLFICSDDKTEDPTPQKLKKAKEEGNVPKSAFLISAVSLAGIALIVMMGGFILDELKRILVYFLHDGISRNYGGYDVVYILKIILPKILIIIILPGCVFLFLSIVSNIMQTGFMLTPKMLKPNFKDFNPINTIKNIFRIKALFDLFRDVIVVCLLCYFSYEFVTTNLEEFIRLGNFRVKYSFSNIVPLFTGVFMKIFMVVFVIGVVDFAIEKFRYKKRMKMTKQEVKEEFKQMEGDPEVKAQIRQKGKEIIMQNMMSNVKDSSVVITNPTHISVALRYKQGEDMAPKLVAKGINHIAFKIKELANEHNIPIVEDKYLARFIYKNVDLDEEIPEEIYKAVADILTYIYKLNNKKKHNKGRGI